MGMIKGLFKVFTSAAKGAEAGLKQQGKGFSWQMEDLKTTPYLYHVEHVRNLLDQAMKSSDPKQMILIKQYILRHKAGNIPSYKSIIQSINHKLKPPKTDHQMIIELKKEIQHMKHLINGKSTSFHDVVDMMKEFI